MKNGWKRWFVSAVAFQTTFFFSLLTIRFVNTFILTHGCMAVKLSLCMKPSCASYHCRSFSVSHHSLRALLFLCGAAVVRVALGGGGGSGRRGWPPLIFYLPRQQKVRCLSAWGSSFWWFYPLTQLIRLFWACEQLCSGSCGKNLKNRETYVLNFNTYWHFFLCCSSEAV